MDYSDIDLRALLALLRRHIKLIFTTLVLTLGLAAGVLYLITPVYSAAALILFDPSGRNLLVSDIGQTQQIPDAARMDSEVELLRSEPVLLAVLANEDLVGDPEFGVSLGLRDRLMATLRLADPQPVTGDAALGQALARLKRAVSVSRRGSTYLIEVSARSVDPQKAARLANALAEAYIDQQVEAKVSSMVAGLNAIQARTIAARDALVATEGQLDGFISDNLERIAQSAGNSQLPVVAMQLEELSALRDRNSTTLATAQTGLRSGDWSTLAQSLQSDAIAELDRQRVALAGSIQTLPELAPEALDLRAQLAEIETALEATANAEIGQLRQRVTAASTTESELREEMRASVLASALEPEIVTSLYAFQQGASLARTEYQALLARAQELEAQANLQIADSRLVSAALAPTQPAFPSTGLMLLVAGIAGLGLGVALAFLYDHFVGGITSLGQLESTLRLPANVAVPHQRNSKRSNDPSVADQIADAPLSRFSEGVRRTRTLIDRTVRAKPGTGIIVMVTSSLSGEGKTALALALARSYALSGRNTLLIDCDLRKPSLHRQLGRAPSEGLFDYLRVSEDTDDLLAIVSDDPRSAATVILGAHQSDVPTDQLLAGPSFARLMRAARQSFDIVILDTPPLEPVIDGLYIAQYADAAAFLVQWGATSQTVARKSAAALARALPVNTPVVAILSQDQDEATQMGSKYDTYYVESTA